MVNLYVLHNFLFINVWSYKRKYICNVLMHRDDTQIMCINSEMAYVLINEISKETLYTCPDPFVFSGLSLLYVPDADAIFSPTI